MSGLNGGLASHTYPLMNGEFFPSNAMFRLNDPFFVHFLHRWVPILIFVFIILIYRKKKATFSLLQIAYFRLLFYAGFLQMAIGVCSIILNIPIALAILHQLGAVLIITIATAIAFSFNNK